MTGARALRLSEGEPKLGGRPMSQFLQKLLVIFVALVTLGGCAETMISGPVTVSPCNIISHDVPNLQASDPRRYYWCKPDNDGYLPPTG